MKFLFQLVLTFLIEFRANENVAPNSNIPKFTDTDMIELYHLRSFQKQLIHSSAGSFTIQTSGIALRSTTTLETVVLEYKPLNFSACFLPELIFLNDETILQWDKRTEIFYSTEIDTKYWQQSTFLARINGVVYKRYIRWVESYIETNKYFTPQSICSKGEENSCFTFSETWETFLADRFNCI
jgi:hypothetical protein